MDQHRNLAETGAQIIEYILGCKTNMVNQIQNGTRWRWFIMDHFVV